LEGLFQNVQHCKDFLKTNGKDFLLKVYRLPTLPYDFAASSASYSLSHVVRIMSEVNSAATLSSILEELDKCFDSAQVFLTSESSESGLAKLVVLKSTEPAKIAEAQALFHSLVSLHGYIGLFCDVYSSPVFSHSKTAQSIVQAFAEPLGLRIIKNFSALHRYERNMLARLQQKCLNSILVELPPSKRFYLKMVYPPIGFC
jgi:E3 ubiquitin-protein ligase HUWE1